MKKQKKCNENIWIGINEDNGIFCKKFNNEKDLEQLHVFHKTDINYIIGYFVFSDHINRFSFKTNDFNFLINSWYGSSFGKMNPYVEYFNYFFSKSKRKSS